MFENINKSDTALSKIIKGSESGRNKRIERPKEKRHIFHIKKENTYGIRGSDSTDINQMIRNMNIFEPGDFTIYKPTLCKNNCSIQLKKKLKKNELPNTCILLVRM